MEQVSSSRGLWAVIVTRLIGLWVVLGAGLKLLFGNPGDLPRIVQHLPLDRGVTFKIVIAAELCIGLLAVLRPRSSWLLLLALLVLFDVALVTQVMHGESSCGCFGTKFPVSPTVMLAVDTTLLILLLALRPWSTPGSDASGGIIAILAVVGAVLLPFWLDREAKAPGPDETGLLGDRWVSLDLHHWEGDRLEFTPLKDWVPLDKLPRNGLWIFYRESCPVCADLLRTLRIREGGQREIVLVKLPSDPEETRYVHELPAGVFVHPVELDKRYDYGLTAPGAMGVRDGRVDWGEDGLTLETFEARDHANAED